MLKLLVTVMFLISGLYKLVDPSISIRKLAKCSSVKLNNNVLNYIIILAGLWEIIGTMSIYIGNKTQQLYGVYSLAIFTILVTLLCYFPAVGPAYYPFISNVTTFGGLLCLAELIKQD